MAWILFPLLPGCSRRAANQTETEPVSSTAQPVSPVVAPVAKATQDGSSRTIQFRGLDNDYRGNTRVLPNEKLIHGKDEND